jgi:imidazolonepropionase-like amidohydrolase
MKCVLNLLFILCAVIGCAQEPVHNASREVVFRNVNVIPMDREGVLQNKVVVVKNGKITAVGDAQTKYSKDALVIDAKGKYLMPGLW